MTCSVASSRSWTHHIDPQAKGGPPTLSNVTLRCEAHNEYAAEADYGAEVVARRIAEARQSRRAQALAPGTVPAPELFDAMKLRS